VNVDALDFYGALIGVLWIALAVAIGVWVFAAIWVVSRAVSRRLERRYLPGISRWSRRRSGLAEDAGPWACPDCSSVNPPTTVVCYRCALGRSDEAPELRAVATDPGIYHRPGPPNEFDPSRYRGPGAPPPAADASAVPPALPASPVASLPAPPTSPPASPPAGPLGDPS
jgi:hypothetical protein